MNYRPSAAEELMARLPDDLAGRLLESIIKEKNRMENGPWTDEEIRMKTFVKAMAVGARKTMEKIAASCFP